jgi:hypothetical protein
MLGRGAGFSCDERAEKLPASTRRGIHREKLSELPRYKSNAPSRAQYQECPGVVVWVDLKWGTFSRGMRGGRLWDFWMMRRKLQAQWQQSKG